MSHGNVNPFQKFFTTVWATSKRKWLSFHRYSLSTGVNSCRVGSGGFLTWGVYSVRQWFSNVFVSGPKKLLSTQKAFFVGNIYQYLAYLKLKQKFNTEYSKKHSNSHQSDDPITSHVSYGKLYIHERVER